MAGMMYLEPQGLEKSQTGDSVWVSQAQGTEEQTCSHEGPAEASVNRPSLLRAGSCLPPKKSYVEILNPKVMV